MHSAGGGEELAWPVSVKERLDALASGHQRWAKEHKSQRPFPGGPYVLLHSLFHLLIHRLPCAAAIRPARSRAGLR